MKLTEVCNYLNNLLKPENFEQDIAINGLQVACSNQEKEIKKIVFAVDACEQTIQRAIKAKADLIIVHHGLFWGKQIPITGVHYNRIKLLIQNDIALYASHIPLDANEEVGNNFGLAKRLELSNLEKFSSWRGMVLGVKGILPQKYTIEEIVKKIFPNNEKPLAILPFGKKEIQSVGIISGGAAEEVADAIEQNLDLYITGEISHENYHQCLENKMNFLAGGHYQTETVGVSLLMKKISQELNIETEFIEFPTNL